MNKIKHSKQILQYNAFFRSPISDYSDLSDRLRLLEKLTGKYISILLKYNNIN